MIEHILVAVCIAMIAILLYALAIYVFGRVHKSHMWFFHLLPHKVNVDSYDASPYVDKVKKTKMYAQTGMWPTIDDPVLGDVACQIADVTENMSDASAAACILRFVQQNIVYVSDSTNHGKSEYWELPINTFKTKRGDCEDSAFLCASLMYLCGLDAILVHMDGHMTVACTAKPWYAPICKKYYFNGKTYYRAETTTTMLPYGMATLDTKLKGLYSIERPNIAFKKDVKPK